MNPGRTIFAGMVALMGLTLTAGSPAIAHENDDAPHLAIENGGVVILHTIYQVCPNGCTETSLVMVASDADLNGLHLQFQREAAIEMVIRIIDESTDTTYAAVVQCTDRQFLTGHVLASGTRVLVVSQSYASARGWI